MFHDFLVGRDLMVLPIIALGIFGTTFTLVLAYVFLGWRTTETTDRVARLPLADDETNSAGTEVIL